MDGARAIARGRTGPITEREPRPESALPENRLARGATPGGAREALRALQDAEWQLALAGERAKRATLLQSITARHAALQVAAMSAISDRYARQIAQLVATTPPQELAAAQDRLKREEAAELHTLVLVGARRLEEEQTAARAAFKTTSQALRRARTVRHRQERSHLAIVTSRWRGRAEPGRCFLSGIGRRIVVPGVRARSMSLKPEPGR